MVAGERRHPGFNTETTIVAPGYQEISLCNHELSHVVVDKFVKSAKEFCAFCGVRKNIYKLPNCFACGRIIHIQLKFAKDGYRANRFCAHCGAQILKDGKLVTK